MAKRFAYVCVGILCLMVTYQLGARDAKAEWDPSRPGQIVGMQMEDCFDRTGQAWRITGGGWLRLPAVDLPMPIGNVKFISAGNALVTNDDTGWVQTSEGWTSIGPFPGSPVALDQQSWGKTKANFR